MRVSVATVEDESLKCGGNVTRANAFPSVSISARVARFSDQRRRLVDRIPRLRAALSYVNSLSKNRRTAVAILARGMDGETKFPTMLTPVNLPLGS